MSNVNAVVGAVARSNGNVRVDAATWTNTGTLDIGVSGRGAVTVKDKGHLTAAATTIGSQGSLTVGPSVVDISGNFTLMPKGVLSLDIAGTTPDLFSQLNISGFGLFQGTVNFDFLD